MQPISDSQWRRLILLHWGRWFSVHAADTSVKHHRQYWRRHMWNRVEGVLCMNLLDYLLSRAHTQSFFSSSVVSVKGLQHFCLVFGENMAWIQYDLTDLKHLTLSCGTLADWKSPYRTSSTSKNKWIIFIAASLLWDESARCWVSVCRGWWLCV